MFDNIKILIPAAVFAELSLITSINTPLRAAHFIAQTSHESAGFKCTEENLNYSAQALRSTFTSHFTAAQARDYQNNPQRIANRAYANRMGNGDEASGDGYRYRGRGYLQITGRENYLRFSRITGINIVDYPQDVALKYPMASAAWFFDLNKIWKICDQGSDEATITAVTQKINGGINGLPKRIALFNRFYSALTRG